MDKDKTCLFSGRFDRAHCGHIRTLQLLGQRFKKVIVVVLDYEDAAWPIAHRVQVLRDILSLSKGEYEVVVNNYHFGKIGPDEILKFEFDVYVAGNPEVLKHVEQLIRTCPGMKGKETLWMDRPYEFNATDERLGRTIKEML